MSASPEQPAELTVRFLGAFSQRAAALFLLGYAALGAMVATVLPAFQAPDEDRHWWAGLRRASVLFGGRGDQVCGAFVELPHRLEYGRIRWNPGERMRIGLGRELPDIPVSCTSYSIPYGVVTTYPAVVIGFPLFRDAVQDGVAAARYYYFSRLIGGLLVALLFWRVVAAFGARAPTPGLVSLSVLLWSPLFVQQTFGVTADGVIVLYALAMVAVCLRAPRIPWIDWVAYLLFGVTAVWTKPTIVPLTLVPVAWVLARHFGGWPWRRAAWRDLWAGVRGDTAGSLLIVTSLALCAGAFLAYSGMGGVEKIGNVDDVRNSPAQLAFVQENVSAAYGAFVAAVRRFLTIPDLAGVLGWLDTPLDPGYVIRWGRLAYGALAFDAVFAIFVLVSAGPRDLVRRLAGSLATASLVTIGVFASMVVTAFALYVTWSPLNAAVVEGVQARYFFPSLIVGSLALAAARRLPSSPHAAPGDRLSKLVGALALLLLALVFAGLFARLYLTLWARYW